MVDCVTNSFILTSCCLLWLGQVSPCWIYLGGNLMPDQSFSHVNVVKPVALVVHFRVLLHQADECFNIIPSNAAHLGHSLFSSLHTEYGCCTGHRWRQTYFTCWWVEAALQSSLPPKILYYAAKSRHSFMSILSLQSIQYWCNGLRKNEPPPTGRDNMDMDAVLLLTT